MKKLTFLFAFLLFSFFGIPQDPGQDIIPVSETAVESPPTIFNHLYRDTVLNLVLAFDHDRLLKNKNTNNYQPGTLRIQEADGKEEVWDIELRPRGNMRRKVCDIPPIKIRFMEEQLQERGLDKRRSLKMVILCRKGTGFEQLLLREYLAYRLYNIMTPYSYRVQLARITYRDTEGNRDFMEGFAFFIEHPKDLAERTGATILGEEVNFSPKLMKSDESEMFAMFQYMIGNTDWHFYNNHNVDILGKPGTSELIPIPFDFDYSGLVKTTYAVPSDKLRIKHVVERYYQGCCREEEETLATIQQFLDKKDAIMGTACEFPYFRNYSRNHINRFLDKFFRILEDPKARKREILKHCDMWPVD